MFKQLAYTINNVLNIGSHSRLLLPSPLDQSVTLEVRTTAKVILTCTVARTGTLDGYLVLTWSRFKNSSTSTVVYDKDDPKSGPNILGDFITTAVFMTSTDSRVIVSNATLTSAALLNSNSLLLTARVLCKQMFRHLSSL